jgi:hypothetical protein
MRNDGRNRIMKFKLMIFLALLSTGFLLAACSTGEDEAASEVSTAVDTAAEAAGDAGDSVSEMAAEAGEAMEEAMEAAGEMADEASEAAGEMADEAMEAAGEMADEASEAAGEMARGSGRRSGRRRLRGWRLTSCKPLSVREKAGFEACLFFAGPGTGPGSGWRVAAESAG